MHAKIYQLAEEPLNEEDFATEEDFYESFVGTIADYVTAKDIDRKEEIQYFVKELEKYGVIYDPQEQSIIFKPGFKKQYFKEKFEKFKKITQELTFKEFAGIVSNLNMWEIKTLIEDKFGDYVYIGYIYYPIDEFFRKDMKEGKKYYFGTVLDYHA